MYRKQIVAEDEENVTILKQVFYENNLQIEQYEQEKDDLQFRKFDWEKDK